MTPNALEYKGYILVQEDMSIPESWFVLKNYVMQKLHKQPLHLQNTIDLSRIWFAHKTYGVRYSDPLMASLQHGEDNMTRHH